MIEILDIIYNVITPILLVAALGIWFGRQFKPDQRMLSRLIIYLFAPALVVRGIANTGMNLTEFAEIGAHVFIATIAMMIVGLILARMMKLELKQESAMLLSIALFNGANYGIPFNRYAFGEAAASIAVVYYAVSVIETNTLGIYLAARGTDISFKETLLNIFKIPLIYATLIGLALALAGIEFPSGPTLVSDSPIPLPLARMVDLLADATIPAMLLLIGMQLAASKIRGKLFPVLVTSVAILVIMPFFGWIVAELLGMEGLTRTVGIVQLGMPTAIIASALATEFNGDADFVTSTTLFSTIGSILSLSILVTLIT